MKISGVAGTIMYGCAVLFKIQHWPMAGIMMSLGLAYTCFCFFTISSYRSLEGNTQQETSVTFYISVYFRPFLYHRNSHESSTLALCRNYFKSGRCFGNILLYSFTDNQQD